MASSDARPVPLKNVAFRVTFPILDNTGALVPGAAGLDSEVSKDAGTFADCTNEATEIATSSGMYYLDLTSTEMNADTVAVVVKSSTSDSRPTPIVIYPAAADGTSIPVDAESIAGTATATPGSSGGLLIAGSNSGTVFDSLTITNDFNVQRDSLVGRDLLITRNLTVSGATDFGTSSLVTTADLPVNFASLSINDVNGSVAANTIQFSGSNVVATSGKLWVLDGSGNAIAPASTALSTAVWTSTIAGRIDVATSTRMATYTQPTGFLAATFPSTVSSYAGGAVASVTGNVGGNVTGSVGSISGVTFPTNFSVFAIDSSGRTTTGAFLSTLDFTATMKTSLNASTPSVTVSDKTGFSLANGSIASATFAAGATIPRVTLADTVTTYTGNTPQTGDVYAKFNTMVALNSGAYRYTAAALALAPTGGGGGGLDGPSSVTLTFLDADLNPVPLVDFSILTQGPGRSGVDGVANFGLDDGTYAVVSRPTAGTLFANTELVVSGATDLTITGTAIIIPAPPAASQTTGYIYTRDGQGSLQPSVSLYFQITKSATGDIASFNTQVFTATSDNSALLTVTLEKGATYRGRRGCSGTWVTFVAGSSDTYELPSILGTP